jgi:hypothetical protein
MTMRYDSFPYTPGELRYDATPFSGSDPVAPTDVNAGGPYQDDWNTAISITGSFTVGSDPSPTILWSADRPGVFANASALTTTFTPSETGAYVLTLTITPSDTPPVADTASLISNIVAPIVSAGGPYTGQVDAATTLSSASVAAGSAPTITYEWTIVAGSAGSGVFSDNTIVNPTFTPDTVGEYTLELAANPSDGPPVIDGTTFDSTAEATQPIFLTWDDNADNETSYTVQRSSPTNSSFATIATLPADSSGFEDSVVAGTYYYRVYCSNAAGDSGFSNESGPVVVT